MTESDQITAELQGTVEELNNEVGAIRGGWERLTKSNTEISSRVANIEGRLTTFDKKIESLDKNVHLISQTLARIEANQFSEKAAGKAIASDVGTSHQVRYANCEYNRDNTQLGYRGIHNVLENRNGMLKKIELPIFDGSRPFGWITQAERFFRLGHYNDTDKLDLVSVSLQGPVLNWYNREVQREDFRDWPQFKRRLVARFSQKLEENPGKRLFSLRQTGSIADYVNEFEELSKIVTGVDEANLEHVFYLGLKPEMQEVIKLKEPRGLTEHFNAVIRMEDSAFCTSVAAVSQQSNHRRTAYVPLRSSSNYNVTKSWSNQSNQDNNKEGYKLLENQNGKIQESQRSAQEKFPWRP